MIIVGVFTRTEKRVCEKLIFFCVFYVLPTSRISEYMRKKGLNLMIINNPLKTLFLTLKKKRESNQIVT